MIWRGFCVHNSGALWSNVQCLSPPILVNIIGLQSPMVWTGILATEILRTPVPPQSQAAS